MRPGASASERCGSALWRNVLSLVRKNRNPSGGLYRCRRRSARDWRRTNARRFLMKALMLRPAPRLMHAFRQNPLGLSGYTAFFVSSAKPCLGHLGVIRAAYIGLMDLCQELNPTFQTCCYGQILPRHSLRFIAHGTSPIHRATPG